MKKQKKPNLVVLGILTLITVLFWIGFSAYRSFTSEVPIKVPDEILEPISPTLDTITLSKVVNKLFFQEHELAEIILTSSPSPSPTASPAPTQLPEEQEQATESATNETDEATESGDIIQ
ncbi:hypothetical protein KKH23_03990 [Patescibacteria group bacterium]|nr:hypothetical protein [Patescibacteria group bacterium]MBU0776754.1 hypothetical protein [Patescibacteria group bacterium]MBU0846327.1 hypothetical protein [Patescibacteria group bacterium]MBU0922713.1 hypothetical protein [Patescibacteria group bacterium]MBU1066764.1 hypothetical protein [Patescibacteria group bacterium]